MQNEIWTSQGIILICRLILPKKCLFRVAENDSTVKRRKKEYKLVLIDIEPGNERKIKKNKSYLIERQNDMKYDVGLI